MTYPAPKLAGALAIAFAVGCGALAAQTGQTDAPVSCSLDVDQSGRGLVIEGLVSAHETVAGTYRLAVSRRGANLNQGGPFRLAAGETEAFGRISLNGSAAALDASLTLEIDGRSYLCPAS